MRIVPIAAALLALAACGGGDDASDAPSTAAPGEGLGPAFYELGARSGLCAASDNGAAMIVYADDTDANCMVEGQIVTGEDGALALVPRGDDQCRIPIEDRGQSIRLGDGGEACAYYCGGDVSFAGRELTKNWDETPDLRDAAGDPLC